jgi:SAM-dependent methyltransferase
MDPDANRRGWADRSGRFSPAYYARIGPNEVSEILVTVLEYYADERSAILEGGCSSGRHLARLREAGFENLAGIDINDDAFDVVYSVETLQHVHPDDEWVFEELVRVTGDLLVTAENEGNSPRRGRSTGDVSYVDGDFPLYYRDWRRVFSDLGLAQLLCEPGDRDTVRVFRVPERE